MPLLRRMLSIPIYHVDTSADLYFQTVQLPPGWGKKNDKIGGKITQRLCEGKERPRSGWPLRRKHIHAECIKLQEATSVQAQIPGTHQILTLHTPLYITSKAKVFFQQPKQNPSPVHEFFGLYKRFQIASVHLHLFEALTFRLGSPTLRFYTFALFFSSTR